MAFYRVIASLMSAGNTKVNQPRTPTIGSAVDGGSGTSAIISYTGADALATSYTMFSTPTAGSNSGTTSPITVTGLTAGNTYTFQVFASNNFGRSMNSAASNSVTILVPSYFALIQSGSSLLKWDTTNDTTSAVIPTLTYSSSASCGFSNNGTAGYIQGGQTSPYTQGCKVAYIPITTSALAASPTARQNPGVGAGNTGVAGYNNQGNVGASSNRVAFSNDAQSTISYGSVTLPGGGAFPAAASNVGDKQCLSLGINQALKSAIMPYSTEVFSTSGDFPTAQENRPAVMTNVGTAAYFAPGYRGSLTGQTCKWTFSNNSKSNIASQYTPLAYQRTGFYRTGSKGYYAQGSTGTNEVSVLPFSTEIFSISATVSNTGSNQAALSND